MTRPPDPEVAASPPASAAVLQVALAGVLWGTAPIAFDLVRSESGLSATAVSALRIGVAALVLVLIALVLRRLGAAVRVMRARPLPVIAVGAGVAAYQALWFAAITQVGAAVATVISLGLAPVLLTLWEAATSRRRPSRARVLALGAGGAGLLLVVTTGGHAGDAAGGSASAGVLLAIASGTVYAASTLLGRRLAAESEPVALTTSTTAVGALLLVPVAVLTGPLLPTTGASLAAVGYLGVVTMAGGYLLLYAGLRTAPASAAAIATLLEPATATLLAVVLLGERLAPAAVVGIVLILAAVALLERRRRPGGRASTAAVAS